MSYDADGSDFNPNRSLRLDGDCLTRAARRAGGSHHKTPPSVPSIPDPCEVLPRNLLWESLTTKVTHLSTRDWSARLSYFLV